MLSRDNYLDLSSSSYSFINPYFLPISTAPFEFAFYKDEKKIGSLTFDESGMTFNGKAKQSARVFFDNIKSNFDRYRKKCKGIH